MNCTILFNATGSSCSSLTELVADSIIFEVSIDWKNGEDLASNICERLHITWKLLKKFGFLEKPKIGRFRFGHCRLVCFLTLWALRTSPSRPKMVKSLNSSLSKYSEKAAVIGDGLSCLPPFVVSPSFSKSTERLSTIVSVSFSKHCAACSNSAYLWGLRFFFSRPARVEGSCSDSSCNHERI